MANCIGHNFGDGEGQVHGPDGTRKLSLPWLACTRRPRRRWLDLAAWFIRVRGTDPEFFDEQDAAGGPQFYTDLHMPLKYFVQDEPILDKQHAEGHAVRLLYLAAAVSKVGRLLNDQKMLDTAERLWTNIVKHRMYITGAVGSCRSANL